ncbi:ABC transporter ATP-binding protein [Falsarthrobacter nasiphocae]|uniref:ABC-2 type transport system ATP-binding protein n=1 Tax=Falsarthrobacter nasiphocae TaxID=189863 RepID=A0AAE4C7U7_9MICC|nr:ABC transporter ATP-binding protein [Falsarthrobacter nasiphocae]MDR6892884.1 ABC-2 type transport system ATP-binding protein [Falsarthrobacter nasiphocae]
MSKRYEGSDVEALSGVSMDVGAGECVCLLGKNGAGKTTLTSIASSRIRPTSGDVLVSGISVVERPDEARGRIAVVPQQDTLDHGISVLQNLVYHGRYFGMTRAQARASASSALESLGIEELAGRDPVRLSGGQVQKVTWARALVHSPDLILLDEPSTGLDVLARRQTHELVLAMKRRGTAILLTTHDMHEAALLADRIAVIDRGQLLAVGTPAELFEHLGLGARVLELSYSFEDTAHEAAGRIARELESADSVVTVSHVGSAVFVSLRSEEASAASAVIETIAGLGLVELGVLARDPSLEDVFLSLLEES